MSRPSHITLDVRVDCICRHWRHEQYQLLLILMLDMGFDDAEACMMPVLVFSQMGSASSASYAKTLNQK